MTRVVSLLDEHLAALRRDRYSEATLDARERVLRTIPNLEHPTREQICLLYTSPSPRD